MTTLIFVGVIHQAGGQIFDTDLNVALDSQATRDALEFYTSMRELCPPGATNYSWGEAITAFVSGATATGIYTGRVLGNVNAQNPPIADSVTCVTYPTKSADIPAWTFNDFPVSSFQSSQKTSTQPRHLRRLCSTRMDISSSCTPHRVTCCRCSNPSTKTQPISPTRSSRNTPQRLN